MAKPISPEQYGEGMNDAELQAAGWAAGLDVWGPVDKAYTNFIGGNNTLANSQLWSLNQAIRADERERLIAVLEHRAATAEQRRDNVMAGHLRGAARILREAGPDQETRCTTCRGIGKITDYARLAAGGYALVTCPTCHDPCDPDCPPDCATRRAPATDQPTDTRQEQP